MLALACHPGAGHICHAGRSLKLTAIAQRDRLQPPEVVWALGFGRGRTPCLATLHLVFKELDVEAFEEALRCWAQGNLGGGEEAIAIHSKGLRGIHGEQLPGVRLVAAYAIR